MTVQRKNDLLDRVQNLRLRSVAINDPVASLPSPCRPTLLSATTQSVKPEFGNPGNEWIQPSFVVRHGVGSQPRIGVRQGCCAAVIRLGGRYQISRVESLRVLIGVRFKSTRPKAVTFERTVDPTIKKSERSHLVIPRRLRPLHWLYHGLRCRFSIHRLHHHDCGRDIIGRGRCDSKPWF
ncbi:hypothetical protein Pla52o_24820 [Novipirellula galeiformis]|uniref:Uncharacterized protein n=1 Tax=Novipirellula galeiformis TaxID=2528004 RepID=A0A5C6CJG5_9BACT|nr:hypothetical protein Pla52o_24820 [Novipirellula galeiformis]